MAYRKDGLSREQEQVSRSRKRVMKRAAALDQEARDKAAEALAKSVAHEGLCTERWEKQDQAMARVELAVKELKDTINDKVGKLPAGIIAALTGIVGFLAARAFPVH